MDASSQLLPSGLDLAAPLRQRIASIDALRGFVILLMLVDHTRNFFYPAEVGDPMDVASTEPALFFTRLVSHLCAPIFVALTGLGAFLYGEAKDSKAAVSEFLLKRGLFLVALEWTVINFAWTFDPTPRIFFLQVVWAIGLSIIALAVLLHLPRPLLVAAAVILVLGHNLLDPIAFRPGEWGYTLWAILHDRGMIELPWGGWARTSYPVLPWVGVIAVGYAIGPWFLREVEPTVRRRRLCIAGLAMLALFVVLRVSNLYGDPAPRLAGGSLPAIMMSFLKLTKYPPSADFLLLTLGMGALILAAFDRLPDRAIGWLVVFGAAPLFFYILHLYLLHLLSRGVQAAMTGDAGLFGLPDVASIWMLAIMVAIPCWFACRWFGARKRASGKWWMRYL